MIRYTLLCSEDHSFESWFRDSAAFDDLAGAHQIACPACGATVVRKALMAPSVVTSRARAVAPSPPEASAAVPAPAPPQPVTLIDDKAREMRAIIRDLHRRIVDTSDDVGRTFAREARSIHEGASPARSIYGEATRDEVAALLEDGIPLLPMPTLPDEHH